MPSKNKVGLLLGIWLALQSLASADPHVWSAERFPERAGELLYSKLLCGNCHNVEESRGASLIDLSSRVDHDWVIEFLAKPKHERMPAMFDALPEPERTQGIRDVTAWLGTLGGGLKFKTQRHCDAERGSALYHEIGCVACHAPAADFKPVRKAFPNAVPMPDLQKKTSLLALQHFLSHTGKYRPDLGMPQFPLTGQESLDIAAHLLDFQSSDPREAVPIKPWPKPEPGAIERGKQLAEKLNCVVCHTLPGIKIPPFDYPWVKIKNPAGGCLTGEGSVRYDLSDKQSAALGEFLSEDIFGLNDRDASLRNLLRYNCYACHERSGFGGPTPETDAFFIGDPALGDAGRIPPPLDEVGYKLLPEALAGVMANKPGTRVRPYLKTRMPVYSEDSAGRFAKSFFEMDYPREGHDPKSPALAKVDDHAAGRKLLGTNGGVNCISCHRWGDRPALGIQGMDISNLHQRLRQEWFRNYLLDPAKYRPGTLMPALWPAGKATVKDVLDGDAEQQIGAIWAFIRDGKGLPEGFPDRATGTFELVPADRPIIQRTFLEGVGTHAILVGFPGGINLAYDAASARPSLVWRGRFFDAYGTWFSRFAPFEKPLEEKTHAFEAGEAARYLGYELDAAGNPTFLSRVGKRELVRERFEVKDGKLIRSFSSQRGAITAGHPKGIVVEADTTGQTYTYSWK